MIPFNNRNIGEKLQDYVDTDSLINLSSVSRKTCRIYRPWLMKRLDELFGLGQDICINKLQTLEAVLTKCKDVMSALQLVLQQETNAIHREMPTPDVQNMATYRLSPMPDGEVLARRKNLSNQVTAFCELPAWDSMMRTTFSLNSRAFLYLLLSTTERIIESTPQNSTARALNVIAICYLRLKEQHSSTRLLKASERFKREWPTLSPGKQAEVLLTLRPNLRDKDSVRAVIEFLNDLRQNHSRSSGHQIMLQGIAFTIESPRNHFFEDFKSLLIVRALKHIVMQSSLCQHKAVFDANCEHIKQLLESETVDKLKEVDSSAPTVIRLNCLRNNLPEMTAQEQVAVLLTSVFRMQKESFFSRGLVSLQSIKPLVDDSTLTWANKAIPRGFSFIIDVHGEVRGHFKERLLQGLKIESAFWSIVEAPLYKESFNEEFDTILGALGPRT